MKPATGSMFLILAISFQATAAQYVYRDFDTAVSLSSYRSFAFAAAARFEPASAREAQMTKLAERVVAGQLAKRGMIKRDDDSADLLVSCYAFARDRRVPFYPGYDESQLNIYSDIRRWQFEGNLVVDLIDNKTGQVVWRGVAMKVLNQSENYEKPVDKAVTRLFDRYPASRRGFDANYRKRQFYGVLFAVGVMALLRLAIK